MYINPISQKTSTPLQSLILLNDPQVQNAAEVLAALILAKDIKTDKDRIIQIHRRITGRKPEIGAVNEMMDYLKEVEKIHLQNDESLDEEGLKQKAYSSLVLLVYNLDETSQKS